MANLPNVESSISEVVAAQVSGLDLICVISPVAQNADGIPRLYGNPAALLAYHGECEGVEYAGYHAQGAGKGFLFCGIPIVTQGEISREDTSGNAGTSVSTLAAGVDGVMIEHDGQIRVKKGGVVGTALIVLEISGDGGWTWKELRLGTGTTYTLPYLGVALSLTVGTLVAGNVIHTWHGSAPKGDLAGLTLARTKIAAQLKTFRSIELCQPVDDATEAGNFRDMLSALKTSNKRPVYGGAPIRDRQPLAEMSQIVARMTGAPSLTFAEVGETGDTITRSSGSWIADGFVDGDTITVAGSVSNNGTGKVATVSALVLTLDTLDLVAEGPKAGCSVVGTPTLIFADAGSTGTVTRNRGSWLVDGFRDGDSIACNSTLNDWSGKEITEATALVLTLAFADVVAETTGSSGVAIAAGQTPEEWIAAEEARYNSIDGEFRLKLHAGRARQTSPICGWNRRIPSGWLMSVRAYQRGMQVAAWRTADGPVPGNVMSPEGTELREWDDRVYAGAALAARFACLRTWDIGSPGVFVALDLTRASAGSLLQHVHHVAVVNLADSVVLAAGMLLIGQNAIKNADGTLTADALATIASGVNDALKIALLSPGKDGPMVSSVLWTPATNDDFSVPEPVLHGTLDLNLNGTIHSVATEIAVH